MFQKILAWFQKRKQQAMFESEDFDLKEWLDHELKIGETSDEVADFLRGQKIVAPRRNVFACPIAAWIRMVTPSLPDYENYIVVSSSTYTVTGQRRNPVTNEAEIVTRAHGPLPEAVAEFIYQFDHCYKYPDLSLSDRPNVYTDVITTDNLT